MSVGITTNGVTLTKQLELLVAAGLSSVNISLDTLDEDKFADITRRDKKNFGRVLAAIYSSLGKGIKVRSLFFLYFYI